MLGITFFLSLGELMNPYDICVVFGDDEVCCHQVWAENESEAHRSVMVFYKDSTVIGVVFGSDGIGG
jgi:hypothetical protein